MLEHTFSIIKPDAVKRGLEIEIQKMLQDHGLKIIAQKRMTIDKLTAEKFYQEHREKSFFNAMIENICAGEVIVQVLEGVNAIKKNREVMGATNPSDAAEGTIRKAFGINIDFNSVHGSDSVESAAREIEIFFEKSELAA